jgi:hypothetical protein
MDMNHPYRGRNLTVGFGTEEHSGRAGARWSAAYLGLRDAILTHSLSPGTKLPEDELAGIYSVSRAIGAAGAGA